VLKGFESYLAHGKVGLLLIELNAHSKAFGIDPDRVLSFLKDRGYKLYRFGDGYRLYQIYGNRFHVNKPTNIIAAHRSDKAISRICEFAT
jgi:hypothetical protein